MKNVLVFGDIPADGFMTGPNDERVSPPPREGAC
jgi:hypothetical protein